MERLDDLWNFGDPAASEARFRGALDDGRYDRIEILSQLARSVGLQRRYEEAHSILDEAERLGPTARPLVRVLLERGRVFNSSGEKLQARCLFERAWSEALACRDEALAVDAAHMLAITHTNGRALEWNQRAMTLAEASSDPAARKWLGSLHNNIGWTYHDDLQDFDRALDHFERGLAARIEQGNLETIRIARWCIARCKRSLGRFEEALREQQKLLAEGGDGDGFNYEEVAENLLALGRKEEAKPYFQRAADLLSQDVWLQKSEAARIERLKSLAV